MAKKYLDNTGLSYFWTKIKALFANKQDKLTAGSGVSIDSNNVISISGTGEENVQSDWDETDTTSDAYILNKPTLGNVSELSTNGSTANYLRGDGAWVTPPDSNTTYSAGTNVEISSSNQISVPNNNLRVLRNWYQPNGGTSGRPASANIEPDNSGGVRTFLATGSMTTDKPFSDGNILHFSWDNSSRYATQLAMLHDGRIQNRYQTGAGQDDWSDWGYVWNDFYSPVGNGVASIPLITRATLGVTTTTNTDYFTAWIKYICLHYADWAKAGKVIVAPVSPNSTGIVIGYIYPSSGFQSDGTPQYCTFYYQPYSNNGRKVGFTNYEFFYEESYTDTTYSAGSNITLSGTTFSLTKANVTGALGYTPPTTNTTYSAGTGLSLSSTTFSVAKSTPSATKATTSISSNNCTVRRSGNVVIVTVEVTFSATGTINLLTGLPAAYGMTYRGVLYKGADAMGRCQISSGATTLQATIQATGTYYGQIVYIANA